MLTPTTSELPSENLTMKAIFLALTSGLFFPLALPNEVFHFGSPLLGLVSLSPLYLAFVFARDRRSAVYAGMVFGAVSTALGNFWLANFGEFSAWTLGGPILGYIGYNGLLAVALYAVSRFDANLRPALFAVVWTAYEFLKSIGYLGYPWGLAAYPFAGLSAFTQIADVTGVYGLTFMAVYLQALIGELSLVLSGYPRARDRISGPYPRSMGPSRMIAHGVFALLLLAGIASYGVYRLADDREADTHLRVLLVQQNTDSWAFGNEEETLETLIRLSEDALSRHDADLLVWSETSLRVPYASYADGWYEQVPRGRSFRDFLRASPVPLLTGSPYQHGGAGGAAWNAALLIQPDGEISGVYGKRQLVPFAESVPFWEWQAMRRFYLDIVGIQAVWEPGDDITIFELSAMDGPVFAAAPICFEDAFAGVVRDFHRAGAEVLVNLTNNAWSETDSAQTQHFTAARFRSIETRLPMVRSTNAGLTSVIDRHGRLQESLPMFEEGVLYAEIEIFREQSLTVYSTIGDSFAVLMLLLTAVALIQTCRRPETVE